MGGRMNNLSLRDNMAELVIIHSELQVLRKGCGYISKSVSLFRNFGGHWLCALQLQTHLL